MVEGDILKPTDNSTGYCQIYSAQVIPPKRRGMYESEVLYHVYTDFGNKLVLTQEDIDNNYNRVGYQSVEERLKLWQSNVTRVVEDVLDVKRYR